MQQAFGGLRHLMTHETIAKQRLTSLTDCAKQALHVRANWFLPGQTFLCKDRNWPGPH